MLKKQTSVLSVGGLAPLTLCIAVAVGCGGRVQRSADVVPASGTVTMNGQPVAGASVTFHPADQLGGGPPRSNLKPAARAKTDAEGRFRLWTFDENDGAVPGEHVVTINKVEITASQENPDAEGYDPARAAAEPAPKYIVPEKFGNPQTSGLTETVSPDGPNDFRFEL